MNLDRQSFLIFEADRAGNIWIAEREWADMDKQTTLEDVASGQFSDLVSVIEFNAVEHTIARCNRGLRQGSCRHLGA
jgi:hypothetical protein